jgi:hypothetical protein
MPNDYTRQMFVFTPAMAAGMVSETNDYINVLLKQGAGVVEKNHGPTGFVITLDVPTQLFKKT